MFDRFSDDARELMSRSRQAALGFQHDYIGTEHMLLGVVGAEGTVARVALERLGVEAAQLRAAVEKRVRRGSTEHLAQLPFTPRGKLALEGALRAAQAAGHHYIGTGHLLLGLLDAHKGTAAAILAELGVAMETARPIVLEVMVTVSRPGEGPPGTAAPVGRYSAAFKVLVGRACAQAEQRGESVDVEHLLIAMVQGEGIPAQVLRDLGATADGLRSRIEELRDSL
jgi:ATP-dependent Clp protease ATP-binding subunit ClpC